MKEVKVNLNSLSPPLVILSLDTLSIEQPPFHKKYSRTQDITTTDPLPPAKKFAIGRPFATLETAVGEELGEYIKCDTGFLEEKGWKRFIRNRRGRGDFSELDFSYPSRDLQERYKVHGVLVKSHTKLWKKGMLDCAIKWGAHKS